MEESEDERCFDDMNDSVPPIELPPCELGRLEEISELVSSCLPSPIRREKLAIAIENEVRTVASLQTLTNKVKVKVIELLNQGKLYTHQEGSGYHWYSAKL